MRVLLLTDSLGCPRKETEVSNTWTDRVLHTWAGEGIIFYTCCAHGLSAKSINLDYISEIAPDVIIAQFGIVDACRRALSKRELSLASRLPVLGGAIKGFCNKHHYALSRLREIHYCGLDEFQGIVERLVKRVPAAHVYFIQIAPPGKALREKSFRIEEDIARYNAAFTGEGHNAEFSGGEPQATLLNPYDGHKADELLLGDGHHLNPLGLELVYQCVNGALQKARRSGHE